MTSQALFADLPVGEHHIVGTGADHIVHHKHHGDIPLLDLADHRQGDLVVDMVQVHHIRLLPIQELCDFPLCLQRIGILGGVFQLFHRICGVVVDVLHKQILIFIRPVPAIAHGEEDHLVACLLQGIRQIEAVGIRTAHNPEKLVDYQYFHGISLTWPSGQPRSGFCRTDRKNASWQSRWCDP